MAQIALAGRLTRDAEIRYTPTGAPVVVFSIAEDVFIGGEKKAQFFNCAMFGERAVKLANFLGKGTSVTAFGSLKIRKYTDKQGLEQQAIEVSVNDLVLQSAIRRDTQPQLGEEVAVQTRHVEEDIPF